MNDPTNEERAARIEPTLAAYRKAQNGQDFPPDEADIRDLLTDIMHYCDQEKIDFIEELEIARNNYLAEK